MIDKLQKLGFTEKEAAIYLTTLELGSGSAVSTISKKSGINRTTTYDILESLLKKGIIHKHEKKGQLYFEARPPEQLITYLEEEKKKIEDKMLEAETLLPELKTHHRSLEGRPKVYFYEGIEGLIRVYEETLSSSEEILAYASDQANQEAVPAYFPKYYKRRAAKKIPIRAIFPDTPCDRERHSLDKQELRRSRIVPQENLDFTPEINFFDNKMMIADWKEKLGIIIESEEIVQVFKQTFELAWEAAEKHHKGLGLKDTK